jgi:uncharacterized protein YggE
LFFDNKNEKLHNMKNYITLVFLACFVSFQSLAQESDKTAKLTAQGSASNKVSPDWVSVNMSISSKSMDYNQVVKDLTAKYNQLEKELVMAGFRKDAIKTNNYSINKNTVWENGRSKDSGFVGSQNILVEFENDNRKIANLVNTLSKGKVEVDFNFSFGLSDTKREAASQELIKMAVKAASDKANIIASASSVRLKRIIKIQYGATAGIQPLYEARAMKMASSESFDGFNAREIEMSELITITWEIE